MLLVLLLEEEAEAEEAEMEEEVGPGGGEEGDSTGEGMAEAVARVDMVACVFLRAASCCVVAAAPKVQGFQVAVRGCIWGYAQLEDGGNGMYASSYIQKP